MMDLAELVVGGLEELIQIVVLGDIAALKENASLL